jgi:hypothetical protein
MADKRDAQAVRLSNLHEEREALHRTHRRLLGDFHGLLARRYDLIDDIDRAAAASRRRRTAQIG